jgi:hypothetical protein
MNVGLAVLQVTDKFLQALLFSGIQVCELDAEVLTGRPSHAGPTDMDGFLVCGNVHTERDRCTNLYMNSAFNATAAQGKVEELSLTNALISLERNRKLHLHPPLSPLFHWHAPLA